MAKKNKKEKKNTIKKSKKIVPLSFWQNRSLWLPALAVLVITFLVFSPSIGNDFVNWDDDVNILENANVLEFNIKGIFTESVIGGYNPLTTFVFALEHKLFGLDPSMFHLVNILLHLVCTFFVYRIMLLLGLSRNAALLAMLLFGIHPMRVESVTWITELKDVLFGSFYLAALFLYTKARKNKTNIPHLAIIPLFILSLFAKIQAVSLPLSMLVVDYLLGYDFGFQNAKEKGQSTISAVINMVLKIAKEKGIYFLLSLAVGILGITMLSGAETLNDDSYFSFLDRILIGMYSICVYLVKFIFPYRMSPLYPYPFPLPWQVYASPFLFLGLVFGVFQAYRKHYRTIVFAALFFFVNIIFLLQVVGAGQGFLADRFTYIPYIGFFFLLGYGYDFLTRYKPSTKTFLPYIAAAYIGILGFVTVNQISVWKDSESLWLHVIGIYDEIQRPFGNLAHHYRENGRTQDAINYYTEAIKREETATIYNGRGKTYFDMAIKANPRQPSPELVNQAIADYTKGVNLEPDLAEVRINRGAARASIGQYEAALQDLSKGLEQDPTNANGYLNRSLVYSLGKQYENAISDHTNYLKLRPNSPDIYYERGTAKTELGRYQEAVQDFTTALQFNPNQPAYYMGRSQAYKGLGDPAKSNADFEKAQQLRK